MQISNRGMADWMEKFVESLSKKTSMPSEMTKTAEVNINDLPKVVWNDESFRVMFDEEGATVVNDFGNTVTSLKGVTTVEEVDKALNSKQIVTSNEAPVVTAEVDIFAEELKKVSTYVNPADPNQQQQNGQPQDPNQQQQNGQQPFDQTQQQVDEISEDIDQTTASLDMMEKISSLETIVAELQKTVTALTEQQYAHTPIPEDALGDSIKQEEMQHIEQTMQESQKRFDIEHSTDLTTMEGRISLIDKLMQDIDMGGDLADDELVELDLPEDSDPTTDPAMEMEMGTGKEFDTKEVEETPELEDNKEEVETPEVGTNDEVVVDVPEIEVKEDKPEDATETTEVKDEEKVDEVKEDKPEDKKGFGVEKLSSKDAKIFQKRICPSCGEVNLFKAASVGSMVGIYCKDCNAEYAVNTDSEEIFVKKA